VRITPEGKANLEVSGNGLVGLAFAPGRSVILATADPTAGPQKLGAVHHLSWGIQGARLPVG
jgi:hypothetical protein